MNARGTAALLEVLGVFLVGRLVALALQVAAAIVLLQFGGITLRNPVEGLTAAVTDAELVTAAWQMLLLLGCQYAGYFSLVGPINYWHRRRGPSAYGLTRGGHSWRVLTLAGLATATLCLWPTITVDLVNAIRPFGETVGWRQALFDTSWRRWEFWLFTSVLSWGFVAVVEEIFFRGYCQRRLAEDWGDGPAIVGIACLFVFSHTQYLALNAYNAAKLPAVLLPAIGYGVVFARTRSLLPSIVAHAIVNVPLATGWRAAAVISMLVGSAFLIRRGLAAIGQVFAGAAVVACFGLAIAGAIYAVAAARFQLLVIPAVVMLVVAVRLEALERRQRELNVAPSVG